MTRMPSSARPAVRTLLAAALALAALAACCALALAQPSMIADVTIVTPKGEEKHTDTGQISNPEIDTTYTVRKNGKLVSVPVKDGIAIRQLLEETNTDLGYTTLAFPRPGGGALTLTREQIDSYEPPVIYENDLRELWFLGAPAKDGVVRAADHFQITKALRLEQTGAELEVGLKASRTKIDPGESVSFTATVKGGPADVSYRYSWNFDNGETATDDSSKRTAKRTHMFLKAGAHKVVVNVKIAGERRSDPSPVVKIQVGDPNASEKNREGGGTNTTGTADSGVATGSSGAGATYGSGSTTTPPVTPPSTPTPSPDPLVPDIATSGSTVEGNLLADASDPPATSILESAAKAARDGQRKHDDEADGAGVPEAALSIAGVLALLGLGAGIELRQGQSLRLRLPRRAA